MVWWSKEGEERVNTYAADPGDPPTPMPTPMPTARAVIERNMLIDRMIQNVFLLRPNMGGFILVLVMILSSASADE